MRLSGAIGHFVPPPPLVFIRIDFKNGLNRPFLRTRNHRFSPFTLSIHTQNSTILTSSHTYQSQDLVPSTPTQDLNLMTSFCNRHLPDLTSEIHTSKISTSRSRSAIYTSKLSTSRSRSAIYTSKRSISRSRPISLTQGLNSQDLHSLNRGCHRYVD